MIEPTLTCRSCAKQGLVPVLDLGQTPLANGLLKAEELDRTEPKFPLELVFCPACSLVQITETVPPEQLFCDYPYFSSFSETMLQHAHGLVQRVCGELPLGPDSLVIEVASNDGYLLQYYKERGIPVLGIEPAANVAQVAARDRGIPTLSKFFGKGLAMELARGGMQADVIHAHNVLAHVPDVNGFVEGIRTLLKANGRAIIEAPYVKDMIDGCEFDTIYHEHLCYFSLTAVDRLLRRHGLLVADVEHATIHGGTLRYTVAHEGPAGRASERTTALLADEQAWGVDRIEFYRSFADRVKALKSALRGMLCEIKASGGRIAAYGASAKGSTLLNFVGVGSDILEFVVDRSTVKQGHYTPGTHLPILPPEHLLETQPGHVLLLTWNFADEILKQQTEFRRRGGRFIVPVPSPVIV
jgi:SAM-dependent methyltransferase